MPDVPDMNEEALHGRAVAAAGEPPERLAVLSAVDATLRDTIARFREVSGRVTEIVLAEGDRANPEIIVMLQDFDRLEQQFVALSDVLASCNEAWQIPGDPQRAAADAVNGITLADLKANLLSRVKNETLLMTTSAAARDQVF
jgi:hypothetical protein